MDYDVEKSLRTNGSKDRNWCFWQPDNLIHSLVGFKGVPSFLFSAMAVDIGVAFLSEILFSRKIAVAACQFLLNDPFNR